MTARNTAQINWDEIQNTGSTNCPISGASSCGIFANLGTAQAITRINNAGAAEPTPASCGTTCDVGQPEQTLQDPGPDGIYGTADDVMIPLTGYQRTILIRSADATTW